MNYVLKSSIKNNKISLPIKIITGVVIVITIFHFIAPNLLSSFFITIVRPFWNIEQRVIYGDIKISQDVENIINNEFKRENYDLKNLLNRIPTGQFTLAQIIKKPPFSAYDILIIDIGSDNNIRVGNQVYALGNILVGTIVQTTSRTAKVKLFSSSDEKYEVFIGEKNILTLAVGRGGGSFEATLPRDIKIQEGDIVTIPSLYNSTFGTVKKVVADPASSFSTIIFSQPINIYEQRWVLVDTKNSEKDN